MCWKFKTLGIWDGDCHSLKCMIDKRRWWFSVFSFVFSLLYYFFGFCNFWKRMLKKPTCKRHSLANCYSQPFSIINSMCMILRKKKLILTWGSTTFTTSTGRGFKPSILTLSYLGNFNFIPGHFSNNKKLQKPKK